MTIKIIQPRTTYKTVDNFGVLPHFGKYIDVKTIPKIEHIQITARTIQPSQLFKATKQ